MNEEHIIGSDAIYDSMMKCRKGVTWKDSVASFFLRGVERSSALSKQLRDKTYRPSKVKTFRITSPKVRDIASITFRDRVYQRSLNDNEIYPKMVNSFIYDNYACQEGKGTDKARERLKSFLHKYYRLHGSIGYVAQFDIKGYYPNMPHNKVNEMFSSNLASNISDRAKDILHHQYSGDKGYNPGSQLVQIAGISFLNKLDHYIKEVLCIKFYIRYMDDFILIHESKEYLQECYNKIESELLNIGLTLNKKKSKIYLIRKGVPFLGFNFYLSLTGKVYMKIKPELIKQKRRNLKNYVSKAIREGIPKSKVDESYRSWRDHASKGNSYKMLCKMDDYYNKLWSEVSKDAQD